MSENLPAHPKSSATKNRRMEKLPMPTLKIHLFRGSNTHCSIKLQLLTLEPTSNPARQRKNNTYYPYIYPRFPQISCPLHLTRRYLFLLSACLRWSFLNGRLHFHLKKLHHDQPILICRISQTLSCVHNHAYTTMHILLYKPFGHHILLFTHV